MRAVVTGAAGFIGSHLTRRLLRDGVRVVGVDAFTDYYDVALKRDNATALTALGASIVEADLNDADVDRLIAGADVVFHLAGQPGVRASWGSEFGTYTACNIGATQRLLEAARRSPTLGRLVYASSSSVYGNAERYPTTETDRPQPISPYGVTKLAGEHLCSLYAYCFGVPAVSLRYFTVYGPGQRPDMAFTRFALAALRGDDIVIYGTGNQVRDFTYVEDVVDATVRAGTLDVGSGSVFNVAGGSHTSVNEVLQVFAEIAGAELSVRRVEAMAGDVDQTGGSTDAIRAALKWRPEVHLRDGIARQFAWAADLGPHWMRAAS